MRELISQAEYARRRGCTAATVRSAVMNGRITLVEGKVDPERADAEWRRSTRARPDSRSAADNATRKAASGASAAAGSADPPPPAPDEPIDYYAARARREHHAARMAELEADKLAGRLVEREGVEKAVFDAFRALRDRILTAPRRVAADVARLTDQREVEGVITDELRRAFDDFDRHVAEQVQARIAGAGQ